MKFAERKLHPYYDQAHTVWLMYMAKKMYFHAVLSLGPTNLDVRTLLYTLLFVRKVKNLRFLHFCRKQGDYPAFVETMYHTYVCSHH